MAARHSPASRSFTELNREVTEAPLSFPWQGSPPVAGSSGFHGHGGLQICRLWICRVPGASPPRTEDSRWPESCPCRMPPPPPHAGLTLPSSRCLVEADRQPLRAGLTSKRPLFQP